MSFIVFLCWSLFLIGANAHKTDPKEVVALRSIKNCLIDPYKNLANWGRRDPCTSNWNGVICYNTTLDDGYLHVKELLFLARNLSGSLSPQLGRLSYMKIIDFMWNNITGTIPKEIGNITTLKLLLLNGNQLTGSLPDELGHLSNLDRMQVDQNQISGPIPVSFANLTNAKHFHMNNNSLSGQIPQELSQLKNLVHLLLDNNNLSGNLPPGLSEIPNLRILQLDNNNFDGSIVPPSYFKLSDLLKLSLRNCNVQGQIPNWSNLPNISYIDLSLNQLSGSIPTGPLSDNITTIDLSNNNLNGTIPFSFSRLRRLQKLSVANNLLSGSIPSNIWQNRSLNSTERLFLNFEHNRFSNISGSFLVPSNVTIRLQGNPLCSTNKLVQFCGSHEEDFVSIPLDVPKVNGCPEQSCPPPYEYAPASPVMSCFCAAPLLIGYRLKSPGFSDFLPYVNPFKQHLTSGLNLNLSQLEIDSVRWQNGPRLRMYLKIFPPYVSDNDRLFKMSEVFGIREMFSGWTIPDSKVFGPFELLNFTLSDPYKEDFPSSSSGISKGAMVGIVLGAIAVVLAICAFIFLHILKPYHLKRHAISKGRPPYSISIKLYDVKDFTFDEMAQATGDFSNSNLVGHGGYGKVYKGILADGTAVAIKRAQEGSRQGEHEFLTEIEILSRLHHRNLVKLIGYCDQEDVQMLVYEFMPNGSLKDHLTGKCESPLTFAARIRIALDSARGIHYLHSEANPPIFHRDVKTCNILLDSKFTVKVADFGLSRLAPLPEHEGATSHIFTVVKGTPGYLDPEYFLTHKLTDKSDVYSLGVVFLELLTAMPPISRGKYIVREVKNAYHSGMIFSIVDKRMGSYPSECLEKFTNLALKCCQEATKARPSMGEVVRELENIWFMIPEPDLKITESLISKYPGKASTPTSSSPFSMDSPFFSQDVSASDLYEVMSLR